jgi:hypothetical protein
MGKLIKSWYFQAALVFYLVVLAAFFMTPEIAVEGGRTLLKISTPSLLRSDFAWSDYWQRLQNCAEGTHFWRPWVTIFLMQGLSLLKSIGFFNLAIYFLLPTTAFGASFLIYGRFLSPMWSSLFALLTLTTVSDSTMRSFYMNGLQTGPDSIPSLSIVNYPFPLLTSVAFLWLFYISVKIGKVSLAQLCLISFLWGLYLLVHPVDAIFGIAFWLAYAIQRIENSWRNVRHLLISLSALTSGVALSFALQPGLTLPIEKLQPNFSVISEKYDASYFLLYLLLPLALTYIVARYKKVDFVDLRRRFFHVFVCLCVEILMIFLFASAPEKMGIEAISARMALHFFHLYYYVPSLYFLTRSVKFDNRGNLLSPKGPLISRLLDRIFYKNQKTIFAVSIFLLSFYLLSQILVMGSLLKAKDEELKFSEKKAVAEWALAKVGPEDWIFSNQMEMQMLLMNRGLFETWPNRLICSNDPVKGAQKVANWMKWTGLEDSVLQRMMQREGLLAWAYMNLSYDEGRAGDFLEAIRYQLRSRDSVGFFGHQKIWILGLDRPGSCREILTYENKWKLCLIDKDGKE